MPYYNGTPRPSEQLAALLSGKLDWDDAPDAIRSWAAFFIYEAATQIAAEPQRGNRRNMLARIPKSVRPHVETQVRAIWSERPAQRR